jgi:hypothetical protein
MDINNISDFLIKNALPEYMKWFLTWHIFVSVSSQDLDFQYYICRSLLMLNDLS